MIGTQKEKKPKDWLEDYLNQTSQSNQDSATASVYRFAIASDPTPSASGWPSSWIVLPTTETSTVKNAFSNPLKISPTLVHLFLSAKEETFEDGMSSEFSKKLIQLIQMEGQAVVSVLADLILNGEVNLEVRAEALRWIGRMWDPATYESRRWLLERSLFSRFPRIRDGAALGLSSMNDPLSIQYLKIASEREEIDELRADLEQVLSDLTEQ
jgi:hypothetical protein